jgi:hypothetical protein
MLTGATMARIYPHSVELQYEDGTTETAKRNHPLMKSMDLGNWFSIVGCVQAAARAALAETEKY